MLNFPVYLKFISVTSWCVTSLGDAETFLCFSGIPFSNEGTLVGAGCLVTHALPRKKAQLL